jgi:hypothetical protein
MVAYKSLKLHYDINGLSDDFPLVSYIADYLKIPVVSNKINGELPTYFKDNIAAYAVYPLIFLYTKDPFFMLTEEFTDWLNKDMVTIKLNLIAELAQLSAFRPLLFEGSMDKTLFADLKSYCDLANEGETIVRPDIFKEKLAKHS